MGTRTRRILREGENADGCDAGRSIRGVSDVDRETHDLEKQPDRPFRPLAEEMIRMVHLGKDRLLKFGIPNLRPLLPRPSTLSSFDLSRPCASNEGANERRIACHTTILGCIESRARAIRRRVQLDCYPLVPTRRLSSLFSTPSSTNDVMTYQSIHQQCCWSGSSQWAFHCRSDREAGSSRRCRR